MSFQLWNDDNDVVSTLDDTHDFCSKHVRLLKIFFSLSAIFPFRFSLYSFLAVFLRRVHVILHTYFTLLLLSLVRRFLSVSYTHRERVNHLLMLSVRAPLEKCSFRKFLSFSSLYNLSRTVCFFLLNPRLTSLTGCVSVLPSFRSFSKIFHIKLKSRTFISLDDVAPLLRWYFHLLSVEFLLISFFVCLCVCVCA